MSENRLNMVGISLLMCVLCSCNVVMSTTATMAWLHFCHSWAQKYPGFWGQPWGSVGPLVCVTMIGRESMKRT